MSDSNDRPSAPAGQEGDAPEVAQAAGQLQPERDATDVERPRPRRLVTLPMLIGVLAIAIAAAALFWLDGKRTQQALRVEAAQRLSAIEASTQAAARAQAQLATDLRDAQAKVTLLEARLAESQAEQAALEHGSEMFVDG